MEKVVTTGWAERAASWPELHLEEWQETYDTLHMWTQIVGKIKLASTPFINHWWNVTLHLSATGLTTGLIPCNHLFFEMEFDFIRHRLLVNLSDGRMEMIELRSMSVADFYSGLMEKLSSLGIDIHIWPVPVEVEDRTPFNEDRRSRTYDRQYAAAYWRSLMQAGRLMEVFRSGFTGKASPVHFFWGSFDLAVTFFSGRPAPEHPGGPNVGREVMIKSYNAELASMGFWGGKGLGEAAFYAYAYPAPEGYSHVPVRPHEAYYNETIGEFILPYEAVRNAPDPDKMTLDFFESTFNAAKELGRWDKSPCMGRR